jgi:hypothetical protein
LITQPNLVCRAAVLLPHQAQRPASESSPPSRDSTRAPRSGASTPHLQQLRRRPQQRRLSLHPRQYSGTLQLSCAHRRPCQSTISSEAVSLGGISNESARGHDHRVATVAISLRAISVRSACEQRDRPRGARPSNPERAPRSVFLFLRHAPSGRRECGGLRCRPHTECQPHPRTRRAAATAGIEADLARGRPPADPCRAPS